MRTHSSDLTIGFIPIKYHTVAKTSLGKVEVGLRYYPKKSFWSFFEKRVLATVHFLYGNDDSYVLNYREDGSLEYSERLQQGRKEYASYHQNGRIATLTVLTDDNSKHISKWDVKGQPIFEYRYDPKTRTETTYHPNGLVKQQHHCPTNKYKEFTEDGKLKRQGLWVGEYGTRSTPLDYTLDGLLTGGDTSLLDERRGFRFTSGNGEYKMRDPIRREYNERIKDLMEGPKKLPPTDERKKMKEALLKSYKSASKKNIENIRSSSAKWPAGVSKKDGGIREAVYILKKARKGASRRANVAENDSR